MTFPFPVFCPARALVVTSYANTGGQGARTGIITVTGPTPSSGTLSNMVNGSVTVDAAGSFLPTAADAASLTCDFGSSKVIDEITWYQNNGLQTSPTFLMRASPDNATWTNFGSLFNIAGTTSVLTQLAGNQTAFRYYQFQTSSGTWSVNAWVTEVEFKIGP